MGTKFDELKVAFVIDDLIKRDFAITLLEELLGLFPNSVIYTYAHNPGAILGPIEQRRIVSTYLSQKIKKIEDWNKYQFLAVNAKEQIVVPCSYDLCLKFSRGLGHLVPVCSGVPTLTYFVDDTRLNLPITKWRQKIFKAMIHFMASKGVKESAHPLYSSTNLYRNLDKEYNANTDSPKREIIVPGLNRKEFRVFPRELIEKMGGKNLTLVDTTECLGNKNFEKVIQRLNSEEGQYFLIGAELSDEVLSKFSIDPKKVLGEKCDGELVPLLQRTKRMISFVKQQFPENVLKGRLCEVPVYLLSENQNFMELLNNLGIFSCDLESVFTKQEVDPKLGSHFDSSFDSIGEAEINQGQWKKSMIKTINKLLISSP